MAPRIVKPTSGISTPIILMIIPVVYMDVRRSIAQFIMTFYNDRLCADQFIECTAATASPLASWLHFEGSDILNHPLKPRRATYSLVILLYRVIIIIIVVVMQD